MSYGRRPQYIWSDGDSTFFGVTKVPEAEVNQFLYSLLLSHRRDDLSKRLLEGRKLIHDHNGADFYLEREDDVIKGLMGL
ncbi:hypothetical protein [Lederbergia lenta]|uniref:hypothetical protein n=1 Tax=Lederbergia lenta TaxID=1467 RepID=UPI0020421D6D|nr:hypothetical protein [Lederbergia lenta]MCM3109932.1 hypothetical protein [Lederbergia lenta]